jgi:hypothetical protein
VLRWREPAAIADEIDRIRSLRLDALRRRWRLVTERSWSAVGMRGNRHMQEIGVFRSKPAGRLRGWAYRTRTGESGRELSDWIYVTTSFEEGAMRVAETLRVRAA